MTSDECRFDDVASRVNDIKLPNPGLSLTWLVEICLRVLAVVMPVLTPTIKKMLEEFLVKWYASCVETPNPWDDFLCRFLMRILGIPIPGEK